MKKILTIIIFAVIAATTAFAGDIPESYLRDEVQIFFGEVISYYPDSPKPSIEVHPVKSIKGDVSGNVLEYVNPNVVGDFKVRENYIYLFTYSDEVNGTDIFDVTTYDTNTLKLKNVEGDMWRRFEKYMNEGRYGVAKIEGKAPSLLKWIMLTAWIWICSFIISPANWLIVIAVGIILSVIVINVRKKKNRKGEENGDR